MNKRIFGAEKRPTETSTESSGYGRVILLAGASAVAMVGALSLGPKSGSDNGHNTSSGTLVTNTAGHGGYTGPEFISIIPGFTNVDLIARDEGPTVPGSLKDKELAIERQIPVDQHGELVLSEIIHLPPGSAIHEAGYPVVITPSHLK